jgi:hypothetical protein
MSLSPSSPPGAPSLAEVLIQRTFAKPVSPFIDREFLEALEHADADQASATGAVTGGQAGAYDAPAPRVDVRA